jgi:hypothetical protein
MRPAGATQSTVISGRRRLRRHEHLYLRARDEHDILRTALSTATSASTSIAPLTRAITSPMAISARLVSDSVGRSDAAGVAVTTGPNAGGASAVLQADFGPLRLSPTGLSLRSCRLQSGRSAATCTAERPQPCRRATADTRLQALAHNARLIARTPPASTAASNQLVPPDINHRLNGRVRLAFELMPQRVVESIAHGLALGHPPCCLEMLGRRTDSGRLKHLGSALAGVICGLLKQDTSLERSLRSAPFTITLVSRSSSTSGFLPSNQRVRCLRSAEADFRDRHKAESLRHRNFRSRNNGASRADLQTRQPSKRENRRTSKKQDHAPDEFIRHEREIWKAFKHVKTNRERPE